MSGDVLVPGPDEPGASTALDAASIQGRDSLIDDASVVVDDVEGLPRPLVDAYVHIALRHAVVREVDPGVFLAVVAGLEGAWGDGGSPDEALEELAEAIVGWVAVKRRVGATDIPLMEGIDLNPRP